MTVRPSRSVRRTNSPPILPLIPRRKMLLPPFAMLFLSTFHGLSDRAALPWLGYICILAVSYPYPNRILIVFTIHYTSDDGFAKAEAVLSQLICFGMQI